MLFSELRNSHRPFARRFAQRRQKRIRIARPTPVALVIDDNEVVRIDSIGLARDALEHTGCMQALELDCRPVFFVDWNNLDRRRVGKERSDHQTGAIAQRMRAEQRVRRAMLNIHEALQFFSRQDHGRHCGSVDFKKQEKALFGSVFAQC